MAVDGLRPISPVIQAAAKLDRHLARALDELSYPRRPFTGFAPVPLPKPSEPAPVAKGKNPMGASPIRRLSSVLKDALADIQREAETLAGEIVAEVGEFKKTVQEGRSVQKEIREAHAEFKATLGLGTNGAEDDTPHTPPLDSSTTSGG